MIDPHRYAEFVLAVIAISLAPGPDMVYVLSRGVGQGRIAGLMAALGSATGIVGHTVLSTIGVSALLVASPAAFSILKIAGICYLTYLGVRMLYKSGAVFGGHELSQDSARIVWMQGLFTNLLNPNIVIFFLAFIPQFIDPRLGHVPLQFLTFGFTLNLIGTSWLCIVAISASALKTWFHSHPVATTWQQRATGVVFILLAAKLIVA